MAIVSVGALCALACGSGHGQTNAAPDAGPCQGSKTLQEAIKCLQGTGALPTLDTSDDLAGPDADHNGIRDDIDAYIAKRNYTPPQLAAVRQLAKAYQTAVVSNPVSQVTALPIGQQMDDAITCAFSQFPHSTPDDPLSIISVHHNIEKLTLNTALRLKAYLDYNHQLDGTTWAAHHANVCVN